MSVTQAISYPSDFVADVKAEYPGSFRLFELLDANSVSAGRWLDDGSRWNIKPGDVLEALSNGEDGLEQLRQEAEKYARRQELYRRWLDMVRT